ICTDQFCPQPTGEIRDGVLTTDRRRGVFRCSNVDERVKFAHPAAVRADHAGCGESTTYVQATDRETLLTKVLREAHDFRHCGNEAIEIVDLRSKLAM